ncbi:dolichol kinase [Thermoplasmatales archaeon SG8-52-1]|nr:MAG: dolichol kinase [Thermoplasmatales archaeon SG8-52-1]
MGKVIKKIQDTKRIINSIDFDAHWYRRVFHTFGASFLIYYMLPTDIYWINFLKSWMPLIIVIIVTFLEILRLKGKISSDHFFGLRVYEKNRVGSYIFFAVAILILLRFFPQQIAIPCILCACLADPIMGEIRKRFRIKYVYISGFLICMLFFIVTWYKADVRLLLITSIIGAIGAVIGETKKFWFIDDDFMIQMIPAIMLLIIWFCIPYLGFSYPDPIIYQGVFGW